MNKRGQGEDDQVHDSQGQHSRPPFVLRRPDQITAEVKVRRTQAPITFAVRSGCPMCERARRTVEHSARRYHLAVEEVDVKADHPDVYAQWKYDLPVILIDGRRRFSGHISPTRLEQALQSRMI
ncbi:MAG: glutaredoxin family protein [Planctomycetota bacterium]